MTCYVQWDRIQRGRKSLSICGEWVRERDIATDPTCPECQKELAKQETTSAEDMFGPSTPGTQVHSTLSDPLAGYRPKGARS